MVSHQRSVGEVLNLASRRRKDNCQNQASSIFKDFQDKRCFLVDKATLVLSVGLSEEDANSYHFRGQFRLAML